MDAIDLDVLQLPGVLTGKVRESNGLLGTFDPTNLLNGGHVIRLISTDAGGQSGSTDVSVSVSGSLKLGAFILAFNDVSVPPTPTPIPTPTPSSVVYAIDPSRNLLYYKYIFGQGWAPSAMRCNSW